ncbi:MAG: ATP-dependent 6-phosphofructokinase [Planctomycetota bacterium]|nr:ATP-dependent 6-phosphofructokinase [Planctomycetota bacterium]
MAQRRKKAAKRKKASRKKRTTRRKQRIAILTGGGDCPGLNAVIRAVVKTAQNVYGWEVYGVQNGVEGFLEPRGEGLRLLTRDDVAGLLPRGGTIIGASNRLDIFNVPKASGGTRDMSGRVASGLKRKGIHALITVGGDGTSRMAYKLFERGINVVSVPKTIDNDIKGTDRTFGFDTAVRVVSQAIDRLYTTAESHHRVMLVEVMGRDSGFIALHGGMAGGAEAILIPEIPYDPMRLAEKVGRRAGMGRNFSIVVVAEGAMRAEGPPSNGGKPKGGPDVSARNKKGGNSYVLAEQMRVLTNLEVRNVVLGHTQRGGTPTAFDRILATTMGHHAVTLVAEKSYGRLVSLRGNRITSVPLARAAGAVRTVNPKGPLVRVAREMGMTFAAADGSDDPYSKARARHGAP